VVRKPGTLELFPYALLAAFAFFVLGLLVSDEAQWKHRSRDTSDTNDGGDKKRQPKRRDV
jgi:hypothetical protein